MSKADEMLELSLFSGAGGGLLGSLLLGWKPIGYVEYDDYCQRVIAQRIRDGILPEAPIFGDVREFIQSGAAAAYRGFADVVTGGFPCQPFSVAGKRAGADDSRNMWPATIECIRLVRPRFCLLENVPGILTSGYFGTILGDLAQSGYDCRWRILSAAELGAPHKRDRLWICAHAQGERNRRVPVRPGGSRQASTDTHGMGEAVAHANGGCSERTQQEICPRGNVAESVSEDVAHAHGQRQQKQRRAVADEPQHGPAKCSSETLSHADGSRFKKYPQEKRKLSESCEISWWEVEPELGRLADGIPNRVDRLRAAGNGQVPAVARAAWEMLNNVE